MQDGRSSNTHANILVVDDSATRVRLLDELLSEAGHVVRSAHSGKTALKLVDEFTPDVILMRIIMPEVNGYELCRTLRGKPALEDVLVIFMSEHEESFDTSQAHDAGGVDFIRSPVNREELLTRLGTQLSLRALNLDLKNQLRTRTEELNSFREIVEQGSMRVIVTDTEGNIKYVNPAFTKITGYTLAEVIHKNPNVVKSGTTPNEVYQDLWNTIKAGKVWTGELQNKKKDSSLFWEVATIAPVMDQDGNISHFVGVTENVTERRRLSNELQSTQQHYKQLVDAAIADYSLWRVPSGLSVDLALEAQVDLLYHAVCTDANQSFWELFGLNSKDEIIGKEYLQLVKEKTLDQAYRDFILNGYELRNYETSEALLDGRTIYSLENWVGEVEDGVLINIWNTSKNITEQKKAEHALEESERKFRTLIEHANDGILVLQGEDHVYCNPRWLEITGYSLGECQGLSFATYIHPDDVSTFKETYQRISTGMSRFATLDFRFITQTGVVRWLNAKLSSINWEGHPAAFLLVDDITERKQAQGALQESLDQLELAVETAQLGIWTLDVHSGQLDWNDTLLDIYGISREDFNNKLSDWENQVHPEDKAYADSRVGEIFEGKQVFDVHFRINRPDGSLRYLEASGSPIFNEDNEVVKLMGINQDITNLVETEDQVRYQAALLDKVNDAIISTDAHFHIVSWNRAAETIYGWSAAEVLGKRVSEILPTTYPNSNLELALAEFHKEGQWEGDVIQSSKQGEAKHISANVVALRDENNVLVGAITVSRDISDRRKAELALLESQERLALATDAGQIGIWDWDVQNDKLIWDEITQEHYGIKVDDTSSSVDTWKNTIHPDDLPQAERDVQAALQSDKSYQSEYRVIRPDGSIRYFRDIAEIYRDEQGKAVRMIGVNLDITAQKEAEHELASHRDHLADLVAQRTASLQRSEEHYRTVVEDQTEYIIRWQPDGTIIFVNDRICRLFNRTRVEILNTNAFDLVPADVRDDLLTSLRHISPVRPIYSGKYHASSAHGDQDRWFEWNQRGIFSQTGELLAIQVVGRDITQQKRIEEVLQRRTQELEASQRELQLAKTAAEQANQAKSTFLANMSHEIRTPMNAILGFSQLLRNDPKLSENQQEKIATIVRSGEHLLDLINDVLEMSKIESGRIALNLTTFTLSHLLYDLQNTFAHQASTRGLGFEVVTREEALAIPLYSDESKIRRVIVNLLSNAIKFTEQGSIQLRLSVNRLSEKMLSLAVEVQDTGIGVAPDEMAVLFEPFEQTSSGHRSLKGSGLGLAICKQYIELMGGTISATSVVERGSTFHFKLPIRQGKQDKQLEIDTIQTLEAVKALLKEYSGSRVLVADDNPTERLLLREILVDAGFVVYEAQDGAEAIDQFSVWNPDLILMDMNMPLINGKEATQQIRSTEEGKSIPILAVTADAFEEDRVEIMELGVDSFVRKPFQAAELLDVILTQLKAAPGTEEHRAIKKLGLTSRVDLKESLIALPEAILDKLRFATLSANFAELRGTVAQISVDYPDIASGLEDIVTQFDYDTLVDLFDIGE